MCSRCLHTVFLRTLLRDRRPRRTPSPAPGRFKNNSGTIKTAEERRIKALLEEIINYIVGKTTSSRRLLHEMSDFIFVAFVFAGGIRSFPEPIVYNSIRINLIEAFCPPSQCRADVFARLSTTDNTHVGAGLNARGISISASKGRKDAAIAALQILVESNRSSILKYKVVNIGSKEEEKDMDLITNDDFKQKYYRDLDSRRYSMYFNRWSAFQMVVEMEKTIGRQYDWVVHARLDTAWGAPIRPYDVWSNKKMWVQDTWCSDVPDTFALIPRDKADVFFSLYKLFNAPGVACLGGPNFDDTSTADNNVRRMGYTDAQIAVIQKDLCTKIPGSDNVYERKLNRTWSNEGVSERILKRKLQYYGISLSKKTLGMSNFFFYISRRPQRDVHECEFVLHKNFIPWVKDTQHANAAPGVGCYTLANEMDRLGRLKEKSETRELCDDNANRLGARNFTCVTDGLITDWNFMPFRIRKAMKFHSVSRPSAMVNQCVEIVNRVFPSLKVTTGGVPLALSISNCVESEPSFDNIVVDYSVMQLFSLHPRSPYPQRISTFNERIGLKCLTVIPRFAVFAGSGSRNMYALGMSDCNIVDDNQLFTTHILDSIGGDQRRARLGGRDKTNLGRELVRVIIRWVGRDDRNSPNLCMSYQVGNREMAAAGFAFASLLDCSKLDLSSRVGRITSYSSENKKFVFLLERTTSNSSPTM